MVRWHWKPPRRYAPPGQEAPRLTAPPGPCTEAPLSGTGGTHGSVAPPPRPPGMHPDDAAHPPCPPYRPVTAHTAPCTTRSCTTPGHMRSTACHDGARPACDLPQGVDTLSSVEAPGPSPPCARPPRQPSSTSLRRDAASPQDQSWTRNTSRQCIPAAPNGHQGRLRDAPHTYRSPQRSLTARCGVLPGTHAICQRGPRSEATLLPGLRTPGTRTAVPGHGASREKRNAAT